MENRNSVPLQTLQQVRVPAHSLLIRSWQKLVTKVIRTLDLENQFCQSCKEWFILMPHILHKLGVCRNAHCPKLRLFHSYSQPGCIERVV